MTRDRLNVQPPTGWRWPATTGAPIFIPFHSSTQSSTLNAASSTDSPAFGSPPPQSPNFQLTMSLQMQGLENSIVQQLLAGSILQPSSSSSLSSSSSNPGSSSTTSTAPVSSSNSSYNPQIPEQQIKLSQLQVLLQLQSRYFSSR